MVCARATVGLVMLFLICLDLDCEVLMNRSLVLRNACSSRGCFVCICWMYFVLESDELLVLVAVGFNAFPVEACRDFCWIFFELCVNVRVPREW